MNKRFFLVLLLVIPLASIASLTSLGLIKFLGLGEWAYYIIPILALIPFLGWALPWIDGLPPVWTLMRESKNARKER